MLVLGAGFAGIAAGLALVEAGHAVTVIDRAAPGQGASFGNAGIIQAEAVAPYAMPLGARALAAIATGSGNDVAWSFRGLTGQARVLLAYAGASRAAPLARIAAAYAPLIRSATAAHAPWIAAAGAGSLVARGGYLEVARTPAAAAAMQALASRAAAEHAVDAEPLDPDGVAAAEPALRARTAGGVHWRDSWTVADPGALAAAYATLLVRRGGRIETGDALALSRDGAGWRVGAACGAAAVIALGADSPALAARFGLRLPMVRKRGHHRHWRLDGPMPRRPIADPGHGAVYAPMRAGLRICTAADLTPGPARPDPPQLRRAEAAAGDWLALAAPVEAAPWSGVRPCMADMLPVVGAVPGAPGLWLHTGHGHHGLTLAPATAALLVAAMDGAPEGALTPARFT